MSQLVELHGGRVEAESAGPGEGSRFTIWLPLQADRPAPGRAAPCPWAGGELTGLRVLVVDDTPETVEVLGVLLELEGAAVATATGAGEALRLAGAGDFDLILSDISMPEMDGYQLLRELRKQPRTARVPAIALTGFGRNEDAEQARAAGFAGHVIKPVIVERLVKAIHATGAQGLRLKRQADGPRAFGRRVKSRRQPRPGSVKKPKGQE